LQGLTHTLRASFYLLPTSKNITFTSSRCPVAQPEWGQRGHGPPRNKLAK